MPRHVLGIWVVLNGGHRERQKAVWACTNEPVIEPDYQVDVTDGAQSLGLLGAFDDSSASSHSFRRASSSALWRTKTFVLSTRVSVVNTT